MNFKDILKKFPISAKLYFIIKNINKHYKKIYLNSFISSLLRFIFNSGPAFQFYCLLKSSTDLKSFDEFWNVYIGFIRPRKYLTHIRVDRHISNKPYCCCNIKRLPFADKSCQMIYVKHFFRYFPRSNFNNTIKFWKKKLIPGGVLKIQVKSRNSERQLESLKRNLYQNDFYIKNINDFSLTVNGTITITAINENITKHPKLDIDPHKLKEILLILKQFKYIFENKDKICLLGTYSNNIKKTLKNYHYTNAEIIAVENLNSLKEKSNDVFDGAILFNFLEYNNYSSNKLIFKEIKRVLTSNSEIFLIVPEKKHYLTEEIAQLFDKGILTRILDEINIDFMWINLSSTFKMIQALLKNCDSFPIDKKEVKLFLLGVYSLRYNFLNNSRWDNQVRAFEKLGYNFTTYDIKEHSFSYLLKCINKYKPDFLWIAGKVAYDFLKFSKEFFKNSKIKVIYWMWDITELNSYNFSSVIDFMFITSAGEIQKYKKKFGIENVFYIPASIVPEIIHRNKFIQKKYDIGFAGQLNKFHPWYKERTENLEFISKFYNVKIFKNIYNNLPEYYSQCKIVFGGTPYFKDLELYASNRPFVAMACGCCFITNYFKGLERLAKNEEHLLWYNNKEDLLIMLKKYISNDNAREEIQNNAEKLVRDKHNYLIRIQNMMDIINGKSNEFYGFIE